MKLKPFSILFYLMLVVSMYLFFIAASILVNFDQITAGAELGALAYIPLAIFSVILGIVTIVLTVKLNKYRGGLSLKDADLKAKKLAVVSVTILFIMFVIVGRSVYDSLMQKMYYQQEANAITECAPMLLADKQDCEVARAWRTGIHIDSLSQSDLQFGYSITIYSDDASADDNHNVDVVLENKAKRLVIQHVQYFSADTINAMGKPQRVYGYSFVFPINAATATRYELQDKESGNLVPITPGNYKLYVDNWGLKSNEVDVVVK